MILWQLVALAAIFLLFLYLDARRPPKFPPGPRWMPIVGNYLLFRKLHRKLGFVHLVWEHFAERYGSLVGVRLGKDRILIASGKDAVREILTSDAFDARPDGFFFRLRSFGKRYGLVFVDGDFFNDQKKFCMRHLKNFGLGRSVMEEKIAFEVDNLLDVLKNICHEPVRIPDVLELSLLNSFWTTIAGQRFTVGDQDSAKLVRLIREGFKLQDMSGGLLNQMPFLRHVAPEATSYNKLRTILGSLIEFFRGVVDEHRKTICHFDNRDLVDAYIQEINKMKDNKDPPFNDEQLIIVLLDLFMAGAETTGSTMGFAILYLIHHPEIQTKIQEEIDEHIGSHYPKLQDRAKMKYLEAFLMELQRFANVSPTTAPHRARYDVQIQGYVIPKGTLVLASLYSMHMDKSHWGDPEVFRPERFLDKDGNIVQDEWLLPFGIGKRRCMGESLARANMFLFTINLLQNFSIAPYSAEPMPKLEGYDGAAISPPGFKCILTPRH